MTDIGWATRTGRWTALVTGRVEWFDPDTGDIDIEQLGWKDRWAIFGVHSWSWWWVRKFGQLRCGCTRNPVTRKMVLIAMDCPEHGISWDEIKGCGDGRQCCCDGPFNPMTLEDGDG